jgi:hypothetical protein
MVPSGGPASFPDARGKIRGKRSHIRVRDLGFLTERGVCGSVWEEAQDGVLDGPGLVEVFAE